MYESGICHHVIYARRMGGSLTDPKTISQHGLRLERSMPGQATRRSSHFLQLLHGQVHNYIVTVQIKVSCQPRTHARPRHICTSVLYSPSSMPSLRSNLCSVYKCSIHPPTAYGIYYTRLSGVVHAYTHVYSHTSVISHAIVVVLEYVSGNMSHICMTGPSDRESTLWL
jgi:hypothetical protein